jgi:hypothetical protein
MRRRFIVRSVFWWSCRGYFCDLAIDGSRMKAKAALHLFKGAIELRLQLNDFCISRNFGFE